MNTGAEILRKSKRYTVLSASIDLCLRVIPDHVGESTALRAGLLRFEQWRVHKVVEPVQGFNILC